jgi:DNA-binding transcriptional LysR family regulator
MELEWSDLRVILAVCREGSLSGAARVLGQNHSTVFRRINAIEERTGVRFFERMPNGYFMTDAGESARASAERIEGEVHALGREILGQDARLQGKVRITAPEGIAMHIAPRMLAEFCREHPGVTVEMGGGASALDLTRREADVAIRATRKPPDASLGRRVCDFRFAVYATPEHIEAHRDVPLAEQDWVLLEDVVGWLVPLVWKKREHGERRTVFTSGTTIMAAIEAARAGMGVTLLPCYLGDSDDQLVRATDTLDPLDLELWLLTHPDLRQTARVKALMAFLYERFVAQRDLFEGGRVREGTPSPLPLR